MKASQGIGSIWLNIKFSIGNFNFLCFESKNTLYLLETTNVKGEYWACRIMHSNERTP